MHILIDTFGADSGVAEIVLGALKVIKCHCDINITLVGDIDLMSQHLTKDYDKTRIFLLNANESITHDDVPTEAIRRKKNSSMVVGLNALKTSDVYDCLISAGNTGALLFGSLTIVGRINGVKRACLAPLIPTLNKTKVCLVDSGANVDVDSDLLTSFAILGSAYMQANGITNPRVALVNVGTEEQKGNALTKETYIKLKNSNINFVGNMEARDCISGDYDVLVCDGFVGNVMLKTIEGVAKGIMKFTAKTILKSLCMKVAFIFNKKTITTTLKSAFDQDAQGGAVLLGIKKCVIKIHGSANQKTVYASCLQAKKIVDANLTSITQNLIESSLKVYD